MLNPELPKLYESTCLNLSHFKEFMKELRRIDDNIILRMNKTDTHSDGACAEFFTNLSRAYTQRDKAIDYCLGVVDKKLENQQEALSKNPNDYDAQNSLYYQETKRRWIYNERTVEDIVRARSLKVFKDKCRHYADTHTIEALQKPSDS
ncbi:hypothetical protein H4R33_000933 [Dimargaris cristalligena]|uniref:Caffeine-induced death protein 2 n=1 Tax=Dimargaris cristalligena TaxID=215637 RepID=A0A4Q0A2A5_9FUNG|nr:hypothetical protein H4R33_000933 [Dimargaris cristalligena]RKP39462.1 caffeine-induced death protein 2 [Dimargaris cristalligena]|eukprot:RKP39462.1 caffeine-induced death protein 2 [Dimargaris cristalligena]